jgi:hypothetical protein
MLVFVLLYCKPDYWQAVFESKQKLFTAVFLCAAFYCNACEQFVGIPLFEIECVVVFAVSGLFWDHCLF